MPYLSADKYSNSLSAVRAESSLNSISNVSQGTNTTTFSSIFKCFPLIKYKNEAMSSSNSNSTIAHSSSNPRIYRKNTFKQSETSGSLNSLKKIYSF